MAQGERWDALRERIAKEHSLLFWMVIIYVASGKAGLLLSFGNAAVTLIWPPAGLALGMLLILGYRLWPLVFIASGLLYATTLPSVPAVVGMSAGNTVETVLLAYLVNRYADGRHALRNPQNTLRFAGVAILACAASATLQSLTLVTSGVAHASAYGAVWMAQTIGSLVSVLLFTPILIYSSQGRAERWRGRQRFEGAALLTLVVFTGALVFFRFPIDLHLFPTELLCTPVLLWAAFRLGRRAASSALILLAGLGVTGTLLGVGPFARPTPFEALTIFQLFIAFTAVITLSLAALASEYRVAEEQLKELVVTDPLTGLPNNRRLIDVLSAQIARANEAERQFAVIFFDMDGLKAINDQMGHLIGSRALCRMAETLRAACRKADTVARYGGDEFVAVLPDTDLEGARLVVKRAAELLANDSHLPRLSASAGIALYPRDGGTPTTLLSAADRKLYVAKAERPSAPRVVPFRELTAS